MICRFMIDVFNLRNVLRTAFSVQKTHISVFLGEFSPTLTQSFLISCLSVNIPHVHLPPKPLSQDCLNVPRWLCFI